MLEKIKEKLMGKQPKKEEKSEETVKDETVKTEETSNGEKPENVKEQEDINAKEEDTETKEENEEAIEEPIATETEQSGNGIRIEELVTKDELADKFASFEAKYDAILKENEDLKEQNSQLKAKYEESDFGNESKKGTLEKDDSTEYSSFDEYIKNFN